MVRDAVLPEQFSLAQEVKEDELEQVGPPAQRAIAPVRWIFELTGNDHLLDGHTKQAL